MDSGKIWKILEDPWLPSLLSFPAPTAAPNTGFVSIIQH